MQNYINIIEQLSETQVVEITELVGAYLKRYEPPSINTIEEVVDPAQFSDLTENMRAMLIITASLPGQTGNYLRTQLHQNEAYLATERNAGQARGVDFSELLPYAAMVMAFLKAEINFRMTDGKVDFSINVELVSLASLVSYLKNNKLTASKATVKNSVVDSEIDAEGNVHIGDNYHINLSEKKVGGDLQNGDESTP